LTHPSTIRTIRAQGSIKLDPVVHPVGAALPEFDSGRDDSISSPEIRSWDILTIKALQRFIELGIKGLP
jgi:hypothetical protein